MSPIQLFSEGIAQFAAIKTSPETTDFEKQLAEGLLRTLSALHHEVLSLKEQVQVHKEK